MSIARYEFYDNIGSMYELCSYYDGGFIMNELCSYISCMTFIMIPRLALDWHKLASDWDRRLLYWHRIDTGLQQIGIALAPGWRQIGIG